ncbi:MAG TPA: hypothetical protein VM347_25580, partial [Nonomuraea sp.]|nr:hypothetical protein [Nonomuraea sp.]
ARRVTVSRQEKPLESLTDLFGLVSPGQREPGDDGLDRHPPAAFGDEGLSEAQMIVGALLL